MFQEIIIDPEAETISGMLGFDIEAVYRMIDIFTKHYKTCSKRVEALENTLLEMQEWSPEDKRAIYFVLDYGIEGLMIKNLFGARDQD